MSMKKGREFAEALRRLRKAHEPPLNQEEFAKVVGISDGTLGSWETGEHEPRFDTVKPLLDYYGVATVEALIPLSYSGRSNGETPADGAAAMRRPHRATAEYVDLAGQPRRPLVEWGACGVPSPAEGVLLDQWDGETEPLPEGESNLTWIGRRGFAVRIRGQSMTRYDLRDGDIVWVNPELGRAAYYGRPVLARLLGEDGTDLGMVVKALKLDENGKEYLQSGGSEGDNQVRYRRFEIFGVCVLRQRLGPIVVDVARELTGEPTTRFLGDETHEPRTG